METFIYLSTLTFVSLMLLTMIFIATHALFVMLDKYKTADKLMILGVITFIGAVFIGAIAIVCNILII